MCARGLAGMQAFITLPVPPKYLELDQNRVARTKHPSRFDSFRYPAPDAIKMTHSVQAPGRRRPDRRLNSVGFYASAATKTPMAAPEGVDRSIRRLLPVACST